DPKVQKYAVALVGATREPKTYGIKDLDAYLTFGASPRGSLNLVHAGQGLAFLRGRDYVLAQDIHDVAKDVLRHRLVLSYQALVEEVTPDQLLDQVLKATPWPRLELAQHRTA